MKISNFSQKHFLKNNNEANKQEQNKCLNPKKSLHGKAFKAKQLLKIHFFTK